MKYLISTTLLVFTLFLLVTASISAQNEDEQPYPDYLGGKKNLILFDGRMGYADYLDTNSIKVKKSDSNKCEITVKVVKADEPSKQVKIISKENYRFSYNLNSKKMYVFRGGSWDEIKPSKYSDIVAESDLYSHSLGEMAYYAIYHKKFYGDIYTQKVDSDYVDLNDLYLRVDKSK